MTYALRRIEAHMNSECDPELCRLCADENAADDGMSTHRVWSAAQFVFGVQMFDDRCDCDATEDHDAGDEVRA